MVWWSPKTIKSSNCWFEPAEGNFTWATQFGNILQRVKMGHCTDNIYVRYNPQRPLNVWFNIILPNIQNQNACWEECEYWVLSYSVVIW